MSKNKETKAPQAEAAPTEEEKAVETAENNAAQPEEENQQAELTKEEELENKVKELEDQLAKEKKEYLFLMAEFDNFRKRTIKEKAEIIKNGGENALRDILPIIDDFDRATEAMETTEEIAAVKEGVDLIHNKFMKYLERNGVKEMETTDKDFDTELHEAITTFPTDDESKKGKIIDTVQKGYTLNDKVLRHAKVVVGQ